MPSADAGEDRVITENEVATLSGAASTDTDGTIDDYRWIQEAGITVNLEIDPADPTIVRFVVPTIGAGASRAPMANAGTDLSITFPGMATLDGTVADDALPGLPSPLTTLWSQVSGPATVTIGDPGAVDTTASFPLTGTYVLRLTADDSVLSAFDELTVIVNPTAPNQPPTVDAGADRVRPRQDRRWSRWPGR